MKRLLALVWLLALLAGARESYPSLTLQAAGQTWSYSYLAPQHTQGRLPLVLMLHGAGGSAGYYLENAGWARLAREEGVLVVLPEGLPPHLSQPPDFRTNPRVWNTGQDLLASPERSQIDDLAFFRALLEEVQRRWPVDPDRVYCTGHSNGADMTFRLAAAMPDRFAAIAPVSSLCWVNDAHLPHPVPTLCLIGQQDPMIPLAGGLARNPWGSGQSPAAAENLAGWARAMGYSGVPVESDADGVRYGPDFQVRFLEGQGHNWPGSTGGLGTDQAGPNGQGVDATREIWEFFEEHRREAVGQPEKVVR